MGLLSTFVEYSRKNKRNLDKAQKAATDAIAARSVIFEEPYYNRARIMSLNGDSAGLEKAYGKKHLERRYKKIAEELHNYAMFWAKKGTHLDIGLRAVLQALEFSPENHTYYSTAALICRKLEKYKKAAAHLSQAVKLSPESEEYVQRLKEIESRIEK